MHLNLENPDKPYPVCPYCDFAILPGQSHEECDKQLEIDRAWREYDTQLDEEAEETYEAEICPCGHKHDQHYMDDAYCQVKHCDCPQFGKPTENYEIHTITNVGGDPGGFTICE